MKTNIISILIVCFFSFSAIAGGYEVGDKAENFKLKNIDGKMVSLDDFSDAKGFVVIFTCNTCPYAIAYENRIISINSEFASRGYPVIAVNPNDPEIKPGDSYDKMIVRAEEKDFAFPYLFDETQEVYRRFGAQKTPHVYLLNKENEELVVKYIGAIDDNYKDAYLVEDKYLSNAINAVIEGKNPEPNFTKAIGCSIKDKSL